MTTSVLCVDSPLIKALETKSTQSNPSVSWFKPLYSAFATLPTGDVCAGLRRLVIVSPAYYSSCLYGAMLATDFYGARPTSGLCYQGVAFNDSTR